MIFEIPKNKCCMDTMFANENALFDFVGTMINIYSDMQEDIYNQLDATEQEKKDWLEEVLWNYILSIKMTYEPILGMLYHSGVIENKIAKRIIFENFVDVEEDI